MKPPPRPRPRRERPHALSDADISPTPPDDDQSDGEVAAAGEVDAAKPAPLVWMRPARSDDDEQVAKLDEKREQIRAAQRHRRNHQLLYSSIALALTLAVLWTIFFSPLFALKFVKVKQSGEQVSPDAVQAVLKDYLGVPLPRLPMDDMTQAVAALTVVESVDVRRSWPQEVIVSVKGRTAIATQKVGENSYALIDSYGVVLGSRSEQPPGIPLLSIRGDAALESSLIDDVLHCLQSLPAPLRERVKVADIDADALTTLTLDNDAVVVWGSTADAELKARVLQVLVQEEAKVYDVSSPRAPVTK